ncbi:hypothetical protein [Streptomyces subrutilus]|uniref:NodB homology domain-containing protein n=1 Tax=Streptomyces subrutilus TaxID=36818 RepID=A0A5P2UP70_9ACTN|nr:hypothetical protein [Streptomyces subrutilus]QEU80903.1 hypothetical protein CP968_23790 [Streptomyces subrutilus]WSJ29808.1 hypothetical protein OG479_11065 [Streptomyces subrutilus]GGZ67000.1 hypothetical protein GCM10010371_28990 [Streptomyces subrutilus]
MVNKNRMNRVAAAMAAAALVSVVLPAATAQAAAAPPRIDLKVLVVDDGGSSVEAITAELRDTGVPFTRVRLGGSGRPVINAAYLSDTVDGRPRARFQGVVLPNENPFGEGSAEMAALTAYETAYGIRQVDAYTWAHPGVGLEYTDNGGYSGRLDGTRAAVTAAGRAGPFGYLGGAVTFEDNSALVPESYGFMGRPRAGYTSYLDAPVGSGRASLVGEYTHDGRSELVVTFGYNQYQQQFRLLARGIVEWLTQGVHLGQERNYFAVHVDDVFAPDARWSKELNCTPGDYACAGGEGRESTIRMTADDARYAAQWQSAKNFKLDLLFNAGAGEEWKAEHGGTDALTAQLVADRAGYRWMNHTYTHPFLGCVQDTTTSPWTCVKNAQGAVQYMSRAEISAQIRDNNNWAAAKGITTDRTELVTGEHSGLKTLPQQPVDNPNLAGALADNGVKWAGSDNSREPDQRAVGAALTVPRHPMNVYYNTGTNAEMADEYNWIYTSRADGGSGLCEDNPATSTCLPAPVDPVTGYLDHIVPQEARTALRHVLANDPRPHYVHQSNLAEDRTLYPVLDQVLDTYRTLYAPSAPIVNQSMKDTGVELGRRAAWDKALAENKVTAYRIGTTVTVKAPSGVDAPVTAPTGTRKQLLLGTTDFGTAYAGTRSTWTSPELLQSAVTLRLPG